MGFGRADAENVDGDLVADAAECLLIATVERSASDAAQALIRLRAVSMHCNTTSNSPTASASAGSSASAVVAASRSATAGCIERMC